MKFKGLVSGWLLSVAITAVAQNQIASYTTAQQSQLKQLQSEGDFAFGQRRFADAEKAYLAAIEQGRKTSEPASHQAAVLNSLAAIYSFEGRYTEAESLCQQAITLLGATSGETNPELAIIFSTLGAVNLHIGKNAKAEQWLQQAIKLFNKDPGDHHVALLGAYSLLGVALCSQGKCRQADQIIQHALTLCEPSRPGCFQGIATAHVTLAAIYVRRGQYRKAEELYGHALEATERAYGPSNAMLVPTLSNLASLYVRRHRFLEAEASGRRALEIAAKVLSDSDATAKAALATGEALAGQERYEAAEPYFKQSLAIWERSQGPESLRYAWTLQQYARFLRKTNRSKEASVIETRANALVSRSGQTVDVSEFSKDEISQDHITRR